MLPTHRYDGCALILTLVNADGVDGIYYPSPSVFFLCWGQAFSCGCLRCSVVNFKEASSGGLSLDIGYLMLDLE